MTRRAIDEFVDYIDRALDKWGSRDEQDIYGLTSELAALISVFHNKHKYLSIALEGFQGTGKTTVSLLIAKQYYVLNGLGEEEAWRKAFSDIRFSIEDFVAETTALIERGVHPPLRILDDFAFQGASKWRRTREQNDLLEYMQTIRTAYTCLIYSYVDDSAAKFFRINAKIKIVFNMVTPDVSELRVYTRRRNIMGTYYTRVGTVYFDIERFRRENPLFVELYETRYKEMRRKAIVEKGKNIQMHMDRRAQLYYALLLGYHAHSMGRPLAEAQRILREQLGVPVPRSVLPELQRRALEALGTQPPGDGEAPAAHAHTQRHRPRRRRRRATVKKLSEILEEIMIRGG